MLRIIGGDLKRRKLHTPSGSDTTRPMPDHVREAVFNLLRGHTEGQAIFDGFAGSGSIGFEAVSRGASRVVLVEKDRRVAKVLQRNIDELGVGDRVELVVGDALGPAALARCPRPCHLIFFDPPYPLVGTPESWERVKRQFGRLIERLDDEGFAVLRTPWPFVTRPEPKRVTQTMTITESFIDEDGDEMVEIEESEEVESAETLEQARPVDLDLSIDGAEGPETHRYGSMAVHLYMRSRYTGEPAG